LLAREEIFGPVLVTMSFRTPDEAVALANNTRYGSRLRSGARTSIARSKFAARIKAAWSGSIRPNLFDAAAGFGGYRESGFGRRGRPGGHGGISEGGALPRRAAAKSATSVN